MQAASHARVVRCGRCHLIYPHRRSRCTRCGATDRVFALASREEISRAGLLQGVAPRDLRVPRGAMERAQRRSLWEQLLSWKRAWIPELIGRIQRR